MKEELLEITNVKLINEDIPSILYVDYDENNNKTMDSIVPIEFNEKIESWDIIYDKIVSRMDELGILNRVNSDLSINSIPINKNDIYSLNMLIENIKDILDYLSSFSHNISNNYFLLIDSKIYDVVESKLNEYMDHVSYHKNNNIDNKMIIGIKNDIDGVGINVYTNKDRMYTIVEQGLNIENSYYTISYDLI